MTVATTQDSNSYNGKTYNVQKGAPTSMPTDPGHEFLDTLQQLTGTTEYNSKDGYPTIDNSGFASDYATSTTEPPHRPPTADEVQDVMQCFDTQNELPVTYALGSEFAVCDHWFSSLPGPDLAEPLLLHGASSSGLDNSPTFWDSVKFATEGFIYAKGSIFDKLGMANCRIYNQRLGRAEGWIPQVLSIKNVHVDDIHNFDHFENDLQGDYPYQYTFIEPSYGDIFSTYIGGSSQHPMDGTYQGELLIKQTYEALRNSPLWESSVLIVVYDEHGGFYDSVAPGNAQPPDDGQALYSQYNFDFTKYGVRVPAMVISPFIAKNTVSKTVYDHSSVIATLNALFSQGQLTDRDGSASDLLSILNLSEARTDCPKKLPDAFDDGQQKKNDLNFADKKTLDLLPLSSAGNHIGFLQIALKAELEKKKTNWCAVQK
ncbi:alkaline phosphatase family protein [Flavobacterium sp. 3HN19-14]|uniref:alkaline phosphatase family protein n=1 Tax=Flavobacterium sp. 3HN19-14 TaxID=3448133 RepID=UPI003EE12939